MIRPPPRSTRTDTLFPYTTLFRSVAHRESAGHAGGAQPFGDAQHPADVAEPVPQLPGEQDGTVHGRRRAASSASAARTRASTPSQSPKVVCRNSLALGYQGLSSRSTSQRQSALRDSTTQTGRPSAPARCATEVQVVTTRSSRRIATAVSRKLCSRSFSRTTEAGASATSGSRSPFCRLKKRRSEEHT